MCHCSCFVQLVCLPSFLPRVLALTTVRQGNPDWVVGRKGERKGILMAWLLAPTFLPSQLPSSTASLIHGVLTYPRHWLRSCWGICPLGFQLLGRGAAMSLPPAHRSAYLGPQESPWKQTPNLTDSSLACPCLPLMPWFARSAGLLPSLVAVSPGLLSPQKALLNLL